MSGKFRNLLTSGPVLRVLYWLIRIYLFTVRLTVKNEEYWIDRLEKGDNILLCCWHQQFFSAIRHFKKYAKYRPSLMISKSNDGEMIAGVASRTGWVPVRGSSSRNGRKALYGMIANLRDNGLAAHILDGPRGPAGIIKPGAISLAKQANAVIVPFYVICEDAWYFKSWDRFMVPKPFSSATLLFGPPVDVGELETSEEFEELRKKLEQTMWPYLVCPEKEEPEVQDQ